MVAEITKIIDEMVFRAFTLRLREDGILHRHISNHVEYTKESLKGLNRIIGEMVNYKPVPLIISADDFVIFPPKINETIAKKSTFPYTNAAAYITKTTAHKLMVSIYINSTIPGRPTKMFPNEDEAVIWLKTFL